MSTSDGCHCIGIQWHLLLIGSHRTVYVVFLLFFIDATTVWHSKTIFAIPYIKRKEKKVIPGQQRPKGHFFGGVL